MNEDMNVYLINPSERNILENYGDRIPHGLVSIGTMLKQNGIPTKIFDFNHTSQGNFIKDFFNDRPFACGVSVYTSPMYKEAIEISKFLREATKLIAGGYHATAMPETLEDYFDSIVIGEGEIGMLEAIRYYGQIIGRKPDMSMLPAEDFSLIDLSKYGISKNGKRQATCITSRGCPYSCSFCFNMSKNVRKKPIQAVKKELDQLVNAGFDSIYFLDDVFTINKERMEEITDYCKVPFRVTTRANLINEEKISILAKNGCEWLSLGIESGNDDILQFNNKGMYKEDNEVAVRLAHKYGIKTKGFFIIGLPGETEGTANETIDYSLRLRNLGLTEADFYYLTPFPGTPIWANPEVFGIEIIDNDFRKYLQAGNGAKCVINTECLKAERIEELVREAKYRWNHG